MKIVLVCPSNIKYMPYVDNYTEILEENHVNYDIISWDRFNIEKKDELIYSDSKIGHRRGILEYFKYSRFVLRLLKNNSYDKIIVFGIQLIFFLKRYLIEKYNNKFIIDIRDYNRIINYFEMKKVVDNSTYTVISSEGYCKWLPKCNNYIINHNTNIRSLDKLKEVPDYNREYDAISIGCIGALRDYQVNIDFINAIKNNKYIQLNYHGKGESNKKILEYLNENNIKNVILTGEYDREREEELYNENNMINIFRYNDGINNMTALPNRLYNASIYGRPMLGIKGTYLSEIIRKYNLGLIIDSFHEIEEQIKNYYEIFDIRTYNNSRVDFFKKVIDDNTNFYNKLISFITLNEIEIKEYDN